MSSNINTWRAESIEEYAAAMATIGNILTIMKTRRCVLPRQQDSRR
jgi:hypothetical protein